MCPFRQRYVLARMTDSDTFHEVEVSDGMQGVSLTNQEVVKE
jgi:hypothetical protein